MKLFKFLNNPYPYEESIKKRLLISIAFGAFIGLFLYSFKPFDISLIIHPHKDLLILGFGLVTFITMLITYIIGPLIFKRFYNNEKWSSGREIIHIILNILLISIMNIVYSFLFCENCSKYEYEVFEVILYSFLSVFIIGLFPVTFMILIYQNILLKKNIRKAEEINLNLKSNIQTDSRLAIYSNNRKNILNINTSQLIVIEANGNYINVYYTKENRLKRDVIRNTLKKTEKSIEEFENCIRCHKSYIVNLSNLKKVTGNAQGYKLIFDHLNFKIPVSRNLSKTILEKIQN